MMDFKALCEDAGLTGPDADTAIERYTRGMPLTALDLTVLSSESVAQRAVTLTSWYGSDGARVAELVLAGM